MSVHLLLPDDHEVIDPDGPWVRIGVIEDGNSLIHGILAGIYPPYQSCAIGNKALEKRRLVKEIRNELYYYVRELTEQRKKNLFDLIDHSYDDVIEQLRSNQHMGIVYAKLLSRRLKTNLTIITYEGRMVTYYRKSYGRSVILKEWPHHFELIGLLKGQTIITKFNKPLKRLDDSHH